MINQTSPLWRKLGRCGVILRQWLAPFVLRTAMTGGRLVALSGKITRQSRPVMRIVILAAACIAMLCSPLVAETPAPFPQFAAKRIKPPAAGTQKRITVQIQPRPAAPVPPRAAKQADAPDSAPVATARYDWFWQDVSPDLTLTGPSRLEPALVRLSTPPQGKGVTQPRLQLLQDIAGAHGAEILRASVGTQVSPALALAVIAVESAGKAEAVSGAGAQGLMQLMPDTAKRFGVDNSLDAAQNIAGGVRFLDFLMTRFGGDPILVLAGYNAGENSIAQHNGVPPYAETRDYVPKVLAAFQVAKGLCLTPPELISDGCAFRRAVN